MKTEYGTLPSGTKIRMNPVRPWRGKSERRRVLKQRRLDREMAQDEK